MKQYMVWVLVCLGLLSCSHKEGFKRDEMFAALNQKVEITDHQISSTLKLKAQLPRPFNLAVYFANPGSRGYRETTLSEWYWTAEERDRVLSAIKPLQDKKLVKTVAVIPSSTVVSDDLKEVRLAAARFGADAVLVVNGIADIATWTNDLAYTYIALVPMLFVPGNEAKSLFITNATLWDVRSGFLYLSADGEGESAQKRAYPFIDKEKLVTDSKQGAVSVLSGRLKALSETFDGPSNSNL